MPAIDTGDLDTRVRFERMVKSTAFRAGEPTPELVATVWGQVEDVMPSRGERVAEGVNIANRPARLRIRYRTDIDAKMRVIVRGRIMQIVTSPAILGNREWLEMMIEEVSTDQAEP